MIRPGCVVPLGDFTDFIIKNLFLDVIFFDKSNGANCYQHLDPSLHDDLLAGDIKKFISKTFHH